MASIDSLPADQRAVLQLVLQRARSYDDIAAMLAIDRAAVRERALSALDALGPQSELDSSRRALITDYLLGQLPRAVSEDVRSRLAGSAGERAWARVVAAELTPLATEPLPEIPTAQASAQPDQVSSPPPGGEPTARPQRDPVPATARPAPAGGESDHQSVPAADAPPQRDSDGERVAAADRPESNLEPGSGGSAPSPRQRVSSRRGGAIVLGLGLLIAVVVVVIIIAGGGSAPRKSTKASTTAASGASSATSGAATGQAKPVAQVTLTSPTGSKSVGGVAIVVKQGANEGLVIRAQGIPANTTHDAYAVWLYNSPSDNHILGFVNPGVKANGVLQTAGVLPAGAAHYKQLLVTLETQSKPRIPSKIVLQGALSLSS